MAYIAAICYQRHESIRLQYLEFWEAKIFADTHKRFLTIICLFEEVLKNYFLLKTQMEWPMAQKQHP